MAIPAKPDKTFCPFDNERRECMKAQCGLWFPYIRGGACAIMGIAAKLSWIAKQMPTTTGQRESGDSF